MPDINSVAGDQLQSELPSSRRLLRSTAIAAGVAALLLITVVLPAEYGIDPTRVGRLFGLTQMGEIKMALAKEAAADAAADAEADAAAAPTSVGPAETTAPSAAVADSVGSVAPTPAGVGAADTSVNARETRVTLQPGEGKEAKLVMRRGARATYAWSTDGGVVNFLTHGDTANAPANSYHTYGKGNGARSDEGAIVAAFDGMHGWFWRNRSSKAVVVTLRTGGDYEELKLAK
jgi:hypothetical protein